VTIANLQYETASQSFQISSYIRQFPVCTVSPRASGTARFLHRTSGTVHFAGRLCSVPSPYVTHRHSSSNSSHHIITTAYPNHSAVPGSHILVSPASQWCHTLPLHLSLCRVRLASLFSLHDRADFHCVHLSCRSLLFSFDILASHRYPPHRRSCPTCRPSSYRSLLVSPSFW
jgi:hypothetical protein